MNEQVLNETRQIIAGFLRNRRKELGMTQQEVADVTGFGLRTIHRIEQGHFWMNMKQYLLICWALHLFPSIAEMESDTDVARALRDNWKPNPKAMSIQDALKMKEDRYRRLSEDN